MGFVIHTKQISLIYILCGHIVSVRDCIEIWFNFHGLGMIQIKDTARWGV
jgi:hypothetical protein